MLFRSEQAGDKRENDGSLGLGLYIARQIAIAHGGNIAVRSDETATVFTVTLPRLTAKRALRITQYRCAEALTASAAALGVDFGRSIP